MAQSLRLDEQLDFLQDMAASLQVFFDWDLFWEIGKLFLAFLSTPTAWPETPEEALVYQAQVRRTVVMDKVSEVVEVVVEGFLVHLVWM